MNLKVCVCSSLISTLFCILQDWSLKFIGSSELKLKTRSIISLWHSLVNSNPPTILSLVLLFRKNKVEKFIQYAELNLIEFPASFSPPTSNFWKIREKSVVNNHHHLPYLRNDTKWLCTELMEFLFKTNCENLQGERRINEIYQHVLVGWLTLKCYFVTNIPSWLNKYQYGRQAICFRSFLLWY